MTASRREFLERMAGSAVMFGAVPLSIDGTLRAFGEPAPDRAPDEFDLTWVKRITGTHKAVFDVPEVDSGYGVWRASIYKNQYHDTLGVPLSDLSAVVVLRHNGIALAMQQAFWDAYGVGKAKKAMHPITEQPTDKNPAMLSSEHDGVAERFGAMALDKFIAAGGIALACNLALADCVQLVVTKDGLSKEDARKKTLSLLVPGVIVQPSGVFAAIRAQEAGCVYLRAS
ncbi:MAG TPA: hypothetical protein VHE78_14200 [Gemmatimonadaceae bacterium]|nr:hypothetical protein [Gemmatimonadaceae bacterium]